MLNGSQSTKKMVHHHQKIFMMLFMELLNQLKQKKLMKALKSENGDPDMIQTTLNEWRDERIRSQDSIITHMFEVSAEMEPEQGKRYREHVFKCLIVPGRTPHVDLEGDYDPQLIQHLKK